MFFHYLRYFLIAMLLTIIWQAQRHERHPLAIADKNIARALDSIPEDVESMMVAKGPNILLDLSIIQCPDLEQTLQFCSSNAGLSRLRPEIEGKDVLSSVSFAMTVQRQVCFSFIKPDDEREKRIDDQLRKSYTLPFYIDGKLVCADFEGEMICHLDKGVYVTTGRKEVLEKIIQRWQVPWTSRVALTEISEPLQFISQDSRFWGVHQESNRWIAYSFSKDDTKPMAPLKVYETDEPGYVWNYRMAENFRNFSLFCINRRKVPCDMEAELLAGFPVEEDNGWAKKHIALERITPWVLRLTTEDSRNIAVGLFFLQKYFLKQPSVGDS